MSTSLLGIKRREAKNKELINILRRNYPKRAGDICCEWLITNCTVYTRFKSRYAMLSFRAAFGELFCGNYNGNADILLSLKREYKNI